RAAGLRALPTGIDHGTVTMIADRQPVEMTTLRRDVETDGRHALVAFTDDWRVDAERRDFTINALYADPDGTVFDPVGGLADLGAGVVRFIGDPERRLAEDYLRALRFFRFHARFAKGPPDAAALAAIRAAAPELRRLSAERVSTELLKILALPRAVEAVSLMAAAGVLAVLLPEATEGPRLGSVLAVGPGDGLLGLAALLPDDPAAGLAVAGRLRLSRAQGRRLAEALAPLDLDGGPVARRVLLYRAGRQALRDRLILAGRAGDLPALADMEDRAFPLKGADLLALGASKGPGLGRLLGAIEDWWLAEGLAPDRDACLTEARRRIAAGG
ncbi:MAG: CCA tRNA nucleotidyltransferase, partial [Zavarzinia sp.]|nr:CCA tRNA nucleotidyltransferase [Zavarzinia sp.]